MKYRKLCDVEKFGENQPLPNFDNDPLWSQNFNITTLILLWNISRQQEATGNVP